MIVPIVLLDNPRAPSGAGRSSPKSWEEWFDSYRAIMIHFSLDRRGVSRRTFSPSARNWSRREEKVEEWRRTIAAVREVFSGQAHLLRQLGPLHLDPVLGPARHGRDEQLLEAGREAPVTVEEIKQNWREIQDELLAFKKKVNKPILFTEVGWCSLANAAQRAMGLHQDERRPRPADPEEALPGVL